LWERWHARHAARASRADTAMKNSAIVLLIASVGVLSVLLYSQSAAVRQQRRQIQELNAKLDSISKSASLDLDERCADQALKMWKAGGWEQQKMATFSNHYNQRLHKCFMQIVNTTKESGAVITSNKVIDAFEDKGYAEFIWKQGKAGNAMRCSAILPSGEEITCTSPDEFDALVKQYME
jgi:DNA phosphorothioation-dependent restriction protein DptG